MASAVEAAARESNGINPYGSSPDGSGAGGKFRKKPYRRSHAATPYDRPPSSTRNLPGFFSNFGGGNDNGNDGWLRRIVDPAQRIITASAHKLFASVFQKRITRPSTPLPPERVQGRENQQEVVNRSSRENQAAVDEVWKVSSTSDRGSFVDLEKILKQRTFSKSEIDRLTALLHAKTLDSSIANEVEKPVVFSSGILDLKEGTSSIVQKADGNDNHLPATHSVVLDGDVASPAELAKSYMGTGLSKLVPSGFRKDSLLITSSQQTPKLPVMSLVPTSSNQIGVHENGYITPRSRGRSAIYSMARTPYARVHQTTPLKILEPRSKCGDGRSVAPQTSELERVSGSHALKRRSSIFENDIGSVGPLRRIRHKPSLLSPRNNSLLSSTSGDGRLVMLPSTESNNKFTNQSVGNECIAVPSRNMSSVTSKSTEIASKLLEQLDKIASPPEEIRRVRLASLRNKAPLKLSPSDLRGKALKSLEHIASSKFLEIASGISKLDDSVSTSNLDSGAFALQDIDKVEQSGPLKTLLGFNQLPPARNRSEETTGNGNTILSHKVVDLEEANPLAVPSALTSQTFKMSAHEDYFDFDDDDQQNEVLIKLVDNGDTQDSTKIKPVLSAETDAKDEPVPVIEIHGLKERKTMESAFTANSGEKTVSFSFSGIPPTKKNLEPGVQMASFNPMSETSTPERETSVVSSVFTFGKKASSGDEEKPTAPVLAFVSNGPITKDDEKVNGLSTANVASQSLLLESSSSFSSISVGPVPSVAKATELNKVDEKKEPGSGVLEAPVPTSLTVTAPSTTGFFKFGVPTGPTAASQPSLSLAAEFNAPPPERPLSNLPLVASSAANGSDGKLSLSQSASNLVVQVPIFKFGSTTATSETPAAAPVEAQTKAVSGFEKAPLNPFSASSTSLVSNIFGFSSPASNGTSSDKLGSVSFGESNGTSLVHASTSSSGLSTSTQTVPFQFGSSDPLLSFGLAGNTNSSAGSFQFGLSSAVEFSTGASLGVAVSPPLEESMAASSSSSTATNLFGSLQTTATPVFGTSASSSSSPSTGFSFGSMSSSTGPISFGANMSSPSKSIFGSFGASTASNGRSAFASNGSLPASSAAPIFGSAASTSAPAFVLGASAASGPSERVFGNSNTVFSFGQASTVKNDQMNAEDIMAEDMSPAATPPASLFGQQPVSPVPPSLNFVLGSGANPFQFGGQPSFATTPNPSPFAAPGGLDFNSSGGGSFSLGTGGGDKSGRKIIKVKHRQRRK